MQKEGTTAASEGTTGFNNPFGGGGAATTTGGGERRESADGENALDKQRSNSSSLGDVAGSPPEGLSPRPQRDRSASKEWGMLPSLSTVCVQRESALLISVCMLCM